MKTSNPPTVEQVLKDAARQLSHLESPVMEARTLLSKTLKKPRQWLYISNKTTLSPESLNNFFTLVRQRAAGTPLAYLTHQKEFWGLDFYVDQRVLVPRPESEKIVRLGLRHLKKISHRQSLITADIGTGSGCLAVSLLQSLAEATTPVTVYATDISPAALEIARLNTERILGPNHTVHFLHGDLLDPLPEKVDLILANLPYLSEKEYKQTKGKEPPSAMIGGKRGHELVEKMLKQAPRFLKEGGKVIYETTGGKVKTWPS